MLDSAVRISDEVCGGAVTAIPPPTMSCPMALAVASSFSTNPPVEVSAKEVVILEPTAAAALASSAVISYEICVLSAPLAVTKVTFLRTIEDTDEVLPDLDVETARAVVGPGRGEVGQTGHDAPTRL